MDQVLALSSVLLWVVVLFNLLLTLALVRRSNAGSSGANYKLQNGDQQEGPKVGAPAPGFAAKALDGGTVTLDDYAGRATAFMFGSPHCEPCRRDLPVFESMRSQAARSGVDLVLVSTDGTEETQALVEELGLGLQVLVAPYDDNPFAKDYGVMGTPFYCLIDERGSVISAEAALPGWSQWQTLLDKHRAKAGRRNNDQSENGRRGAKVGT